MNRRKRQQVKSDPLEGAKKWLATIDVRETSAKVIKAFKKLPRFHQRALMVLVPITLLLLIVPLPKKGPVTEISETPKRVDLEIDTKGLSEQSSASQEQLRSAQWQEYRVKSGDTLSQVFRANDLNMKDLNALAAIEGVDKPLSRIKEGQIVRFKLNKDTELDILQLERGDESVMFFRLSDGGFGRSK